MNIITETHGTLSSWTRSELRRRKREDALHYYRIWWLLSWVCWCWPALSWARWNVNIPALIHLHQITKLHYLLLWLDPVLILLCWCCGPIPMFISVTGFSAGSDNSMQSKILEKRCGASVLHTSVDVCPSDSKRPCVPQVSLEVCFQELRSPPKKDNGNRELSWYNRWMNTMITYTFCLENVPSHTLRT